MAILVLVFSISLSLIDSSGILTLELANEIEFNSATSWGAVAIIMLVSIFMFKAIALLASYFKRM